MQCIQKMLFNVVVIPALASLIGIVFLASSAPVFSQQSPLKIYDELLEMVEVDMGRDIA